MVQAPNPTLSAIRHRLQLAHRKPKARSWQATVRENALSERSESKGRQVNQPRRFQFADDDRIVVGMWFVYILRCADCPLTGQRKRSLPAM